MSLKDLIVVSDEVAAAMVAAADGSTNGITHEFNPQGFARKLRESGFLIVRTEDVVFHSANDIADRMFAQALAQIQVRIRDRAEALRGAFSKPSAQAAGGE